MEFEYYHNELISNKTFDEIEKTLKDNDFLIKFTEFLKIIGLEKIIIRNFSIIYMINSYPEDVVGDISITINKTVIDHAKDTIIHINNYIKNNSNKDILKNSFYKFNQKFNDWLKKDSLLMIKELTQIFWEVENSIIEINENDKITDNKKEIIDTLKNKQRDIIDKIKKFGGKDGLHYLKNSNPLIINSKIYNQIEDNFKKAFWDKFEKDVNEVGFITVIPILIEIKEYLINLTPSKKNIEEIKDNIDIELIKQMIKNDAFTEESIKSLGVFIIDNVKNIGSKTDDKEMENWKNEFKNNNLTNLGSFLKDFFSKILNKIFAIMKEIKNIVNDPNYQKIKENIKEI